MRSSLKSVPRMSADLRSMGVSIGPQPLRQFMSRSILIVDGTLTGRNSYTEYFSLPTPSQRTSSILQPHAYSQHMQHSLRNQSFQRQTRHSRSPPPLPPSFIYGISALKQFSNPFWFTPTTKSQLSSSISERVAMLFCFPITPAMFAAPSSVPNWRL